MVEFEFEEELQQDNNNKSISYRKSNIIPIEFGTNNFVSMQGVITYNSKRKTQQTDFRLTRGYFGKDSKDKVNKDIIKIRKAVSLPADKEIGISVIKQLMDIYEVTKKEL